VLFEMLTGDVPYRFPDAHATLRAHVMDPIPSLSELAPWLGSEVEAMVNALLTKNPSRRPQDAALVAERLEAIARRLENDATVRIAMPRDDETSGIRRVPSEPKPPQESKAAARARMALVLFGASALSFAAVLACRFLIL
jgi:serine/threonine protein kinase